MPKKLKGWTLWGFSTSILSQTIKKLKGGFFGEKFFSRKKSLTMPKKLKVFGLARYGMLRGKTGKTFLVQFVRPNSAIWCNNDLWNFCRTILVSSGGVKKTLTKSHDYSRLFSKEKRRLKIPLFLIRRKKLNPRFKHF